MKKKWLLSLFVSISMLLAGCGGSAASDVNIEFARYGAPTAYLDEQYDFKNAMVVKSGVDYKLDVYYYDYNLNVEKKLPVTNTFYFTPVELFDIAVVVTASKGGYTSERTALVKVEQKGDPVEELLVTGGFSGFADVGFNKTLCNDKKFIKDPKGRTSLEVNFNGTNAYIYGASVLSLNNFRLLDYWTDLTWENAVIKFWVYNPTDYRLEFQLRIYDAFTKLVDVDWNSSVNVPSFAAPHEWSQIVFSLRHCGIEHTLYESEDGYRHDNLIVKTKWLSPSVDGENSYSYKFFADEIDIVPYSEEEFPDLDTSNNLSAETIEYGWENMAMDEGWMSSNAVYDRDFVNTSDERESLSSISVSFKDKTIKDANGYSVIFSPENQWSGSEELLPSFRHGTLDLDVHFSDNITNTEIQIFAVQHSSWSFGRVNVNPVATGNEWMHISIDFGEHNEFYGITKGIRLGFGFLGVNESNKNNAVIHLDNIIFNQEAGIPEDEIVVARGQQFSAGNDLIVNDIGISDLATTVILDIKITSGEGTSVNVCLLDASWSNYLGYFEVYSNGSLGENYDGASIRALDDGYFRLTLNLSQITKKTGDPSRIDVLYVRGDWTTASGYIDINPVI